MRHVLFSVAIAVGLLTSGVSHARGATPQAGVRGVVTCAATGLPLARVDLSLEPEVVDAPAVSTQSRGDGSFVFDHLADGVYWIVATMPGAAPVRVDRVQVAGGRTLTRHVPVHRTNPRASSAR